MRAKDGKKILLDIEKIQKEKPNLKFGLEAGAVSFGILPATVLLMYVGLKHGGEYGWPLFYVSVFATIFLWFFLKWFVLKRRHPMGLFIPMIIISPFALFSVSFLAFGTMSGVSLWDIWFIPAIWVLVELNAYRISRWNSDDDLIACFRRYFRRDVEGNHLFNHSTSYADRAKGTRDTPRWLYWLENGGGMMILIIGPVLFITSATLKNNFDPRFAIVGIIFFFLGMGVRFVSTEFHTLRIFTIGRNKKGR